MKWTDIVTAISSVVSNIIALAALIISIRRRADLVPGTPVPSYFMAIMKTSTIFAVCGITCGLLSAMLGFAGKPWQAGLFGLAAGIWSLATLAMDRRGGKDD